MVKSVKFKNDSVHRSKHYLHSSVPRRTIDFKFADFQKISEAATNVTEKSKRKQQREAGNLVKAERRRDLNDGKEEKKEKGSQR